jgi:hypothetical protein
MLRARLVALLAVVLVATGCGLPAPYYLAPPGMPLLGLADFSVPRFYVESTTANGDVNEPDFRGFELYYKLYKDEASIQAGFGSDSQLSDMSGFLPMCMSTDTSPQGRSAPLIWIDPLDRGEVFTATLNFSMPGAAACTYTGPVTGTPVSISVRRAVSTGGTECKTFDYLEFMPADADFAAIAADFEFGVDSIFIGVYALSYGKQDLATTIWSSPVYLGWAKIDP